MGYWTDNGAYYYGDAYPQGARSNPDFNLTCCTKKNIMAAKAALDKGAVPINYIQLDDWWYGNFDITLDHFSRISQPHPTPHAPCATPLLVPIPIGC